jgi:hypothetical protein
VDFGHIFKIYPGKWAFFRWFSSILAALKVFFPTFSAINEKIVQFYPIFHPNIEKKLST